MRTGASGKAVAVLTSGGAPATRTSRCRAAISARAAAVPARSNSRDSRAARASAGGAAG